MRFADSQPRNVMLFRDVRSAVISWIVALCAVLGGAPTRTVERDQTDSQSQISANHGAAQIAARRGCESLERNRISSPAVIAPSFAWLSPPRVAFEASRILVSRPFVSLVFSRSSRGPPVG
jgi:hypothetical protein